MISHMRTTLIIDDAIFRQLKKLAAEQNRSLSQVTQEVLQRGLTQSRLPARRKPVRLPTFAMGRPLVDVADRDQLYDVLDRS
jgi:predicted CopG family antitoxin